MNVNWNADKRQWNVNDWKLDDDNWNAGNRVFSRNPYSSPATSWREFLIATPFSIHQAFCQCPANAPKAQ